MYRNVHEEFPPDFDSETESFPAAHDVHALLRARLGPGISWHGITELHGTASRNGMEWFWGCPEVPPGVSWTLHVHACPQTAHEGRLVISSACNLSLQPPLTRDACSLSARRVARPDRERRRAAEEAAARMVDFKTCRMTRISKHACACMRRRVMTSGARTCIRRGMAVQARDESYVMHVHAHALNENHACRTDRSQYGHKESSW